MKTLSKEFNQENFSLTLEQFFQVSKDKLIREIISSSLMTIFSLAIVIPVFYLYAVNKFNSRFNWDKLLIVGYLGLGLLFISLSFLIWNSYNFGRLKKMIKLQGQERMHTFPQQGDYYWTFRWLTKTFFSKKSVHESLIKLKKDMVLNNQKLFAQNRIVFDVTPVLDELSLDFPRLTIIIGCLFQIFCLIPVLKTELNYSIGSFFRIKDTELVQKNFATMIDKFEEFLFYEWS